MKTHRMIFHLIGNWIKTPFFFPFQLSATEFLPVDPILESALHALVIKPLQPHLNTLFSQDFRRSGCLQTLKRNLSRAAEMSPDELNVPARVRERLGETVAACRTALADMRGRFSPDEKLQDLLKAMKAILESVRI